MKLAKKKIELIAKFESPEEVDRIIDLVRSETSPISPEHDYRFGPLNPKRKDNSPSKYNSSPKP